MPNNLRIKVLRKLQSAIYRLRNRNRDFTLITQNCIGGVIYNILGLQFSTPTINMFIPGDSFVRLVKDLPHYLSVTPTVVHENYQDPIDPSICYPVIALEDVQLHCLHSHSAQEAIADWERRKQRVNLENIFVIGNTWNFRGCEDQIGELADCGYPTVIFTNDQQYSGDSFIVLKEDFWKLDARGILRPNITDFIPGSHKRYFEERFDFVKWLNKKV